MLSRKDPKLADSHKTGQKRQGGRMNRSCRQEIAAIEALLRAGHPDVEGLCRALADWCGELRLLQASQGLAPVAPRLAHVRSGATGLAYGAKAAVTGAGRELKVRSRKARRGRSRAAQEGSVPC
jgi:hypothetical protein